MQATIKLLAIAVLSAGLAGCVDDGSEDELDEPALTDEEIALLPDGLAHDHEHAEGELVPGPAEDDAATFDDDEAFAGYDQEVVTGTYGTSTLWDHIGNGYVADAYVYTGSDGRVAPNCN